MEGNCPSSCQSSFNNYVHLVYILIISFPCAYAWILFAAICSLSKYWVQMEEKSTSCDQLSQYSDNRDKSPFVIPDWFNGKCLSTDLFSLVSRMLAKCYHSHSDNRSTACWQLLAATRLIFLPYCFAINCSRLNIFILCHLLMSYWYFVGHFVAVINPTF